MSDTPKRGRKRTLAMARRNEQIKRFYVERGWSLTRIAERYNLTVPRVHQIVNDPTSHIGVPRKPGRKKASKAA